MDNKIISIAGMPNFSELVQVIMENDNVYSYLIYFYLEEISDQAFEDYAKEQCQSGKTLRQVHAEYFASWIPWESCAESLIERVRELGRC